MIRKNLKFVVFLLIILPLFYFSCSTESYYVYGNRKTYNNEKNQDNNSGYEEYNNKIETTNSDSNSVNIYKSDNTQIKQIKNKIPDNLIIPDYKPSLLFSLKSNKKYTVKKGDTLYSICKKFNTTIDEIKKLNNIKNPNYIKPGQKIYIKMNSLNFYNLSEKFKLNLKTENILEYDFINSNLAFSPLEEGNIKFIGEIRGYGLSLIISKDNYFITLSGFDNIYVNLNDKISLKSPLGSIENSKLLFISIFQNNKIIKIGNFIKIK